MGCLIEGHAMKRQSTAGSSSRKGRPQKPRPDFPLFPHLSRKWAKTIRGKTYYFGSWDDPEGALREYLAVRDDLYAGRTPSNDGGPGVADLCNAFLRSKRIKLDADQLSPRTFVDYERCCRTLVNEFGPDRPVKSIGPRDFEKLYARLVGRHAVSTLGREVTMVRSVFKYGFDSDLLEKPVKFGPIFKLPTKQDRRKWKARSEQSSGKRLFSASEIHRLLDVADPQLKAMILLGCNGGLGNTDVANLPISALDLRAGRIDYPRPKTGVGRRIPLWPETVEALQTVIANRRDAADPVDADCVFLTRCGQRWVRFGLNETRKLGKRRVKGVHANPLSHRFNKLLRTLGLRCPRLGFYTLRHTFETVAGGSKDQVAVDAIMGHVDPSMAAEYRHGIDDGRLRAVVEHVRRWLFGEDATE